MPILGRCRSGYKTQVQWAVPAGYLSFGLKQGRSDAILCGVYLRQHMAHLLPTLWRSTMVTLRVFWRLARQLFHEATGAMFGLFAVYGGFAAWKQWKHRPAIWLVCFAIAYAIAMAAYSFSSFRRARRVR